jgi:hypothetical protein
MNSRVTPFSSSGPGSSIPLRCASSVKALGRWLGRESCLLRVISSGFERSIS